VPRQRQKEEAPEEEEMTLRLRATLERVTQSAERKVAEEEQLSQVRQERLAEKEQLRRAVQERLAEEERLAQERAAARPPR
jgi:hypothetical protein